MGFEITVFTRPLDDDEDTAVSAAVLSNERLDALVDHHLFGHSAHCNGPCDYRYMDDNGIAIYQCQDCGGPERRTLADRRFGSVGHERKIPRYSKDRASARMIFDRIAELGETPESCFTLFLSSYCPRGRNIKRWLLFGASPREIALAALRTVEIIDEQGYVVSKRSLI